MLPWDCPYEPWPAQGTLGSPLGMPICYHGQNPSHCAAHYAHGHAHQLGVAGVLLLIAAPPPPSIKFPLIVSQADLYTHPTWINNLLVQFGLPLCPQSPFLVQFCLPIQYTPRIPAVTLPLPTSWCHSFSKLTAKCKQWCSTWNTSKYVADDE